MTTEFDPSRLKMRTDSSMTHDPAVVRRPAVGAIVVLAALTVALIVGVMFWNGNRLDMAADRAPGVTTGISAPALPTTTGTSNRPANSGTPAAPTSR